MSKIDFPIGIFGGTKDLLADVKDVEWARDQLGSNVIFYHQYYLGHLSFAFAKDMSWFSVDVMAIIDHYNNRCSPISEESNYKVENQFCQNENMFLY